MRKALLITILLMILSNLSFAREVSFTEEDRERLRNIELKVERLEEALKAVNQRIDTLQTFMLWGFGILFGGMGILIGFVIWDRRTALTPVIRRQERLEHALRELATKDPKVEEALKHAGLL